MNALIAVLLFLNNGTAPPSVPWDRHGPVELWIAAARQQDRFLVPFSGSLSLTLRLAADQAPQVHPPRAWTASPGWKLRQASPPRWSEGIWTQALIFDPTMPGSQALQLEPLSYRIGEGSWEKAVWKPIPVEVQPSFQTPDLKTLRDITAIEALPAAPPAARTGWWLVPILLALGLAGYVFLGRKSVPPAKIPPEVRALNQLDRLQHHPFPGPAGGSTFIRLLDRLLRNYLEKTLLLPVRRKTTAELRPLLERAPNLSGPFRDRLLVFFEQADLVKFAGLEMTSEERQQWWQEFRNFLVERGATAP